MKQTNKTVQAKAQTNFPNNNLELELLSQGYEAVIGIDEVGRGAWAGPVYVGAFIYTPETSLINGVKDSKLLNPIKRDVLYSQLILDGQYHCEIGNLEMINQYGIGNTIIKLIENILEKFKNLKAYYLIDGYFKQNFGPHSTQIVKGDMKHYAISGASIVAKVERDRLMSKLALELPQWDFASHKGYGTKSHIAALTAHGISSIHRLNYKPIQKLNASAKSNFTNTKYSSNRAEV